LMRKLIILICMLGASCVSDAQGASSGWISDNVKPQPHQRKVAVDCIAHASITNWTQENSGGSVVVNVRSREKTTLTVLASLELIPLQTKNDQQGNGYWAPFSLQTGNPPNAWEKLQMFSSNDATSVVLHPSQLLWAPTISSIWPSQQLFKTAPPGKYRLHIEISVDGANPVASNEIIITIAK